MEEKLKTISVRIPEKHWKAYRFIAFRHGFSMSQLLAQHIRDYLEDWNVEELSKVDVKDKDDK